MLKSLELCGFKSFADRNRFEFSTGLTVIVGPNGSGKSNVVDSIKWVLGEKSMKSLRGKESADVIFNGSSTRKAANSAEVTLSFDNSDKRLSFDASEVVVTRRAYRNGENGAESEYFLNRQPCKLKDIRDLLLGTGLGTHAYSIIEQGRVDSLLQSSPRDRRVLFEEAAGISRFKAKKLEAIARLERIDQNLLRLSSIVDEVESRLNRIKSQAERATMFREYSERLQTLRFQAAAMDYHNTSQKLQTTKDKIQEILEEQGSIQTKLDSADARIQEFEQSDSQFDSQIQTLADKIAANRHSIGVSESVVTFQNRRMTELEGEINSGRMRIAEMRRRLRSLGESRQSRCTELQQAQTQHKEVSEKLTNAKNLLDAAVQSLEELRKRKENFSSRSFELMREISAAENLISSLTLKEETTRQQLDQNETHIRSILDEIANSKNLQADRKRKKAELEALKTRTEDDLKEAQDEQESAERLWDAAKNHLMELHRRHSAMLGRISTLEELQERHEGLSPGVRYLLTEARRHADGPFRDITGLVADLIQVEVDAAALIEVALGETAQYLVVEPHSALLSALRQNSQGFPGRVGFVWMDDFLPDAPAAPRLARTLITNGLEKRPGVLGRADQFIQCEERYLTLFKYLLGETWIVENLGDAIDLSADIYSGRLTLPVFPAMDASLNPTARENELPSIHFVTLAGERYSADGILCIGPQHASSNLISRRSELRTLGSRLTLLSDEITAADEDVQKTQQQLGTQSKKAEALEDSLEAAKQQLFEQEKGIAAAVEREEQLTQRVREFHKNSDEIQKRLDEIQTQLEVRIGEKSDLETQSDSVKKELKSIDDEIARSDEVRSEKNRIVTEYKVELAKSEERLDSLKTSLRQLDSDLSERGKIINEQQTQLEQNLASNRESERVTLSNNARLADYYLEQEASAAAMQRLRQERDSSHSERTEITASAAQLRKRIRNLEEKIHALRLEEGNYERKSENVVARICEDSAIQPAEFLEKITHDRTLSDNQNKSVHQEINQLRSKIQALGNINSEALSELDELTERYNVMSGHYKEITDAKEKLEKLIERINTDSRKIFMQTFERIGEYFYHIFRDLFGGGIAELQLTECSDPLEGGVEILAQPPGKQRLNLSLMSGGEKTMTCVALLFALFKNHPSQFCILDEVDAALDEANTVRLTEILNQFRDQTQFIIISHSKKTMSVGNTIYGITMQDSGVSKQVSVKFEDVSDDGELESLGIRLFPPANDLKTA